MNLYIFNETRRGAVYGVGTYIRELTIALKNTDLHVCVINLNSDKPQIQVDEIDGVRHWFFPAPIPELRSIDIQKQWDIYFRNVVYILRLHIKDKKDLIFHLNYHQSGVLVDELKKTFDCKIISVVHYADWGFTIYDNLPRLRAILSKQHLDDFEEGVKKSIDKEKAYYSKVDHVICLSSYMQEVLCSDYQLNSIKITVIPNGLANTNSVDIKTDKKKLRHKWNFLPNEKIILFAGRMDAIKGLDFLLRAFNEVLKNEPRCRLIIAGSGSFEEYMKESLNICTRITYTGFLDRVMLNQLYQIANVGVVPSLYEPFGYVAVEMMMHGLPIVTTITSGLNEVVDRTCGLKVPLIILPNKVEMDTTVLSEKIIFLLQNSRTAKKMGQNGLKRYLEKYSAEIFRNNMIHFYQSLYS